MSPRVTTALVRAFVDTGRRCGFGETDADIAIALDLLDARDRLAAVERERDELRVAAVDLLAALDAHEDETDGAHYDPDCEDAVYEAKADLRDALTGATS